MKYKNLRCLTYHKIGVYFDSSICWVDTHRFLSDIKFYLNQGFRLVTLQEQICSRNIQNISLLFDDGFIGIWKFRNFFKKHNIRITIFPIYNYCGKYDEWDVSLLGIKFKHLGLDQLKQLSSDGHQIGSHSMTHRDLVTLSDKTLYDELYYSKINLEKYLECPIDFLSAPFSRFDLRTIEIAKEVGYKGLVSLRQDNNPFVICSKAVYLGDNNFFLKAKLGEGLFEKLERRRLNFINKCSTATIVVNSLKSKLLKKICK